MFDAKALGSLSNPNAEGWKPHFFLTLSSGWGWCQYGVQWFCNRTPIFISKRHLQQHEHGMMVMMMKVYDFVNSIRLVHYNPLGGKMAFWWRFLAAHGRSGIVGMMMCSLSSSLIYLNSWRWIVSTICFQNALHLYTKGWSTYFENFSYTMDWFGPTFISYMLSGESIWSGKV